MFDSETKSKIHSSCDHNSMPVKTLDINYLDICREVEERVKKDAPRGCRLPLTKSSLVVNEVAKIYKSELVDILEECQKLDRMLVKRNHPEAEPEKNNFQRESSQPVMSHLISPETESEFEETDDPSLSEDIYDISMHSQKTASQRTPHNTDDQTKSFTKTSYLLSESQKNTEEEKSRRTISQPNTEYNSGDTYQGNSMTTKLGSQKNAWNARRLSKVGDNINESSVKEVTSKISRASKGSRNDSGSHLQNITKENSAQLADISKHTNSPEDLRENTLRKKRKTFKSEPKRILRQEISPQRSTSKNDGSSSVTCTPNRRNVSKYKSKNSKQNESISTEILATPSEVTRRSTRSQGSRKRKSTSNDCTETEENPQPSTSSRRRRTLPTPQLSFPLGQILLYDENGAPRKLIMAKINPNYFK